MPWNCSSCQITLPAADAESVAPAHCPRCGQAIAADVLPASSEEDILTVLPATPEKVREPSFLERWAIKKGHGLLAKAIFLILMLPCGGIGLLIQQWDDLPIARVAQQPHVVSCKTLSDLGPGENPHVVLTDFRLDTTRLAAGRALAFPAELADERQAVRVLVEVDGPGKAQRLQELEKSDRLQGMVVSAREALKFSERVRVGLDHPKLDLDKCWVLQEGKKPPGLWRTYALIGASFLLMLTGLPIWYGAWRIWRAMHSDAKE